MEDPLKLTVISTDVIEIPVYEHIHGGGNADGNVYLEPGKAYECTLINKEYIQFLDCIDDEYIAVKDIEALVRENLLSITLLS